MRDRNQLNNRIIHKDLFSCGCLWYAQYKTSQQNDLCMIGYRQVTILCALIIGIGKGLQMDWLRLLPLLKVIGIVSAIVSRDGVWR